MKPIQHSQSSKKARRLNAFKFQSMRVSSRSNSETQSLTNLCTSILSLSHYIYIHTIFFFFYVSYGRSNKKEKGEGEEWHGVIGVSGSERKKKPQILKKKNQKVEIILSEPLTPMIPCLFTLSLPFPV